MLSPEYVYIVP